MSLLDKLERRFGRFYIRNLAMLLTFGQGAFYFLIYMRAVDVRHMWLLPALVLQGEVWRLLTFVFVPPASHPFLFAFAIYMFYLMATSLEEYWGEFRFNLFILVGYVLTVAVSFITPHEIALATFIGGSVFLAFAFLNPEFVLLIMFILPVKIKWLAWLTWLGYGWGLLTGDWSLRLTILASIANFLVFFWPDLLWLVQRGRRQMQTQARGFARRREAEEPFHRCVACGITDKSHPDMLFRYCRECAGNLGYCEEHYGNHEHVK